MTSDPTVPTFDRISTEETARIFGKEGLRGLDLALGSLTLGHQLAKVTCHQGCAEGGSTLPLQLARRPHAPGWKLRESFGGSNDQ